MSDIVVRITAGGKSGRGVMHKRAAWVAWYIGAVPGGPWMSTKGRMAMLGSSIPARPFFPKWQAAIWNTTQTNTSASVCIRLFSNPPKLQKLHEQPLDCHASLDTSRLGDCRSTVVYMYSDIGCSLGFSHWSQTDRHAGEASWPLLMIGLLCRA